MPSRMMGVLAAMLLFAAPTFGQESADLSTTADGSDARSFAASEENAWFKVTADKPYWVTGEFLFGWSTPGRFPALVTTSTDVDDEGILGNPTTSILFGGRRSSDMAPGLRLGAGYVFDHDYGLGIEAGFQFLSRQTIDFTASSADFPLLARPFVEILAPVPPATTPTTSNQSVLVAAPSPPAVVPLTGAVQIKATVGNFYGVNLDLSEHAWSNEWLSLDALFGYRFHRFDDGIRIRHTSTPAGSGTITVVDEFGAQNDFHGMDFGARASMSWGHLSLNVLGKVAYGNMHRQVHISGTTTPLTSGSGGFLALVSNSGTHTSGDWVVVPEAGVTLAWQLRRNVRLTLGYSGTFLQQVAQAAEQIDTTINPALLPNPIPPAVFDPAATPQRPQFRLNDSDVWVQSLNLGVDFTF